MWQENAACLAADPNDFAPVDLHTTAENTRIDTAAHRWCATCPVVQTCARFADDNRLIGLWGGVYRWVSAGRYLWRTITVGAVEPQLVDRRTRGAA